MTTLVLGAAVSGTAAAKLALRLGHRVTVYDARHEALTEVERLGCGVAAGPWRDELLDGVTLVVASPGIPEHAEPVQRTLAAGLTVRSEMDFAAGHLDAPYVAVTGTNGKTTVVEAATHMLEAAGRNAVSAGNIGTALSDVVGEPCDIVVVEASSFQLRFSPAFHPSAAAVTNLAPDHLDWHGSLEAYRRAKAMIFANMTEDEALAFDADDLGAIDLVTSASARHVPVSGTRVTAAGYGFTGDRLVVDGEEMEIPDVGPAYVTDLALAAALARAAGAGLDGIRHVVAHFIPGPHRRTVVGTWGDVTWIDDSKATNPHAAAASARAYQSVVLIAGGRNKGLDLTPIASAPSVRHVVGIGEAAAEFAGLVAPERFTHAASMADAVAVAASIAVPGEVVLLAPGCASFDMFDSYAHRGDAFAAAARTLEEAR